MIRFFIGFSLFFSSQADPSIDVPEAMAKCAQGITRETGRFDPIVLCNIGPAGRAVVPFLSPHAARAPRKKLTA
jgi:hypothetical protein